MATMKKPKIEQGEEEAAKSNTQIPDDREALLEFMDQRANSIKRLKDQISILERKVSSSFFCYVWLIGDVCTSFLAFSGFDLLFLFQLECVQFYANCAAFLIQSPLEYSHV